MLWVINKPKITQSALNAANVIFDNEEPLKAEDTRKTTIKKRKQKKKIKRLEKCNNYQDKSCNCLFATKDCIATY